MVNKDIKNGEIYYKCSECLMRYSNKSLAEKCEEWCKKHKSCNINLIKYAVKVKI